MATENNCDILKSYYADNQEEYYDAITKFDGMYYPPLWVCQTVNDCKTYCVNHLPDIVANRVVRHLRGRFGAFLTSCEILAQDNPEITQANNEWWSDINILRKGDTSQCCCVCGQLGFRIFFEPETEFRERFNKLREDVEEWLTKNCDETERQRCFQYMEENWDEYQLFHELPI